MRQQVDVTMGGLQHEYDADHSAAMMWCNHVNMDQRSTPNIFLDSAAKDWGCLQNKVRPWLYPVEAYAACAAAITQTTSGKSAQVKWRN